MRYSVLLGKVSGTEFSFEESETAVLLSRLGFLYHTGDGAVSLLPLGTRVLQHIEEAFEAELIRRGAQKIEIPQLVRRDLLLESGRYELFDGDSLYYRNEEGEEYFQTGHYEEVVVNFLRPFAVTEKDFPICIYFYSNKTRPVNEQNGSALASREFRSLNIFSAHRNIVELNNFLPTVSEGFRTLLESWGIRVLHAETELHHSCGEKALALVADMDGKGNDLFLSCPKCGYTARCHVAKAVRPSYVGELKTAEKVEIPHSCDSYEKLAELFGVPDYKIIHCDLFRTENAFVMTVCRGDYPVSREKLMHQIGCSYLRKATATEAAIFHPEGHFLSPVGRETDDRILVIADETLIHGSDFILGLNEENAVLQNANLGIDFDVNKVLDIAIAKEGDLCIQCGVPLTLRKESEVVRLIKSGSVYSQKMGLRSLVRKKKVPVCLGSYTVDLLRIFYIVAEKARSTDGFRWPQGLAPFLFYLYCEGETLKSKEMAADLYSRYSAEILQDDRSVSPAEKEKTARLLGIPYVIIVDDPLSDRNCVAVYSRQSGKKSEYPIDFPLLEFKNRNNAF